MKIQEVFGVNFFKRTYDSFVFPISAFICKLIAEKRSLSSGNPFSHIISIEGENGKIFSVRVPVVLRIFSPIITFQRFCKKSGIRHSKIIIQEPEPLFQIRLMPEPFYQSGCSDGIIVYEKRAGFFRDFLSWNGFFFSVQSVPDDSTLRSGSANCPCIK